MFVRAYAGAVVGIDAVTVTVEVNITGGGLGLYLVGLPDNAVKESEQRIRAAFENSGERMSGRKVVVSLAPADLRKEGSGFDLPIAVGILAAMERIDAGALEGTMFAGELSLDGSLKPVRGVLPLAVQARRAGFRRLVVPVENAAEGAVVEGVEVYATCSTAPNRWLPSHPGRRSPTKRPLRPMPRILPTCAARPRPSGRWRSPRRAATT